MALRIALHLGTLRGFGSASVGRNTLASLAAFADRHEFACWVPREWPPDAVPPALRARTRPMESGLLSKFLTENGEIRRELKRWPADRLFSLGDTSLPRAPVPHLLFVQQAFLAYEPAQWGFAPPPAFRAKIALMAAYFRLGLPSVSRLVVQTEDMKQHLAARWRLQEDRIAVVPSALAGEVWQRLAEQDPAPRPAAAAPYVCYVAGAGVHKNHLVLPGVAAALPARHREVRFVLTASADALPEVVAEARRLGVLERFHFAGAVAGGELPGLLEGAAAAVIPSKLESFGLTYFEALAAGCPVVAADRGFAREALAGVGLYAPPDDAEAYAAHLCRLLDSPAERLDRARRGRARFREAHLSWPETAARYLRILENL